MNLIKESVMLKSHETFHSANGKRLILIADDETELMDAMELYFRRENLALIKAENGEQALELFIASAGKETEGVDAVDVRRGLSSVDTVKAVQLATVFFIASSQAGNARITK